MDEIYLFRARLFGAMSRNGPFLYFRMLEGIQIIIRQLGGKSGFLG